jgi:hypothetical protein
MESYTAKYEAYQMLMDKLNQMDKDHNKARRKLLEDINKKKSVLLADLPEVSFSEATGKITGITDDHILNWMTLYPTINIVTTIQAAQEWIKSNHQQINTSNIWLFLERWLKRAVEYKKKDEIKAQKRLDKEAKARED